MKTVFVNAFAMVLAFVLTLSCMGAYSAAAMGGGVSACRDLTLVSSYAMTDEEISAKETEDFEKFILMQPRTPSYDTRVEKVETVIRDVSGFLANQLSGGYRFQSGGGLFYTNSGGAQVTVGISVALPHPFNLISTSLSLGSKNEGTFGSFANAPNTSDYFKLYTEKRYQINIYATYYKPFMSPESEWKLLTSNAISTLIAVNTYCKAV